MTSPRCACLQAAPVAFGAAGWNLRRGARTVKQAGGRRLCQPGAAPASIRSSRVRRPSPTSSPAIPLGRAPGGCRAVVPLPAGGRTAQEARAV